MHAGDNAASSAFHITVSASPRVPTPDPVSRVALRLMIYHGKMLALAYAFIFIPRPDKMPLSLPPLPPASERSYIEQQPSQNPVSSARVTRSQSRAREEAGLPPLLAEPLSSTPVLNLSELTRVDEVGRIQKQARLASSLATNLTPEPEPLSDDSDSSSLFHPRRRSSE
eukprot:5188344-Pleurochrysis_carterae.AAC.1